MTFPLPSLSDVPQWERRRLQDLRLLPFCADLPLEMAPVNAASFGTYEVAQLGALRLYRLHLDGGAEIEGLQVGASYSCAAQDAAGQPLRTHWMICTSVGPAPGFGLVVDAAQGGRAMPLLPTGEGLLLPLAELTDIVALYPLPQGEGAVAQAQVGTSGWLVMLRLGCPPRLGFLVREAVLPSGICPGAGGLTLAARARHSTQAVSLDGLDCVAAETFALFLRGI